MAKETINWHERAKALTLDGRAFINGERTWSRGERKFDNLSPIDGRYLSQTARCDAADVDHAVAMRGSMPCSFGPSTTGSLLGRAFLTPRILRMNFLIIEQVN